MLRVTMSLVVLALATQSLKAGDRAFIPGHVFVSEIGTEGCFQQRCWIREIDPDTGDSRIFADYSDGLCDNSGLRFTPDGSRLRVLNLSNNTIQDFDADGNATIVYTAADGLGGPFGGNGLLWNARGDFFVANEYSLQVLRFPFDGAPPQVVADQNDGVRGGGGLAIRADAGLFMAAFGLLSIRPDGNVEAFDNYGTGGAYAYSVTFDRQGNLYVATEEPGLGGVVRRYFDVNSTRSELVASALPLSGRSAIDFSEDESTLYYASSRNLLAIDVNSGATRVLFTTPSEPPGTFVRRLGRGIAVYKAAQRGDLNCDDRVNNFDIDPFVLALTDAAGYQARYGWCDRNRADVNGDGGIDNFDIDAFVEAVMRETDE